jgi:stalled ribosome rescue protein Dom34
MSEYFDAIIFIDRREAKLFHFSAKDEMKLVFMHTAAQRVHHQADHEDGTEHAVDDEFLRSVVGALDHSGHTLLCGPGNAKYELQAYLQNHEPDLAARIAGVEELDDSKDDAILGIGRRLFSERSHRGGILPKPSPRHFDVPAKS